MCRYLRIPRDSSVVPFWFLPVFLVGVIMYYPKLTYIGVSRYIYKEY